MPYIFLTRVYMNLLTHVTVPVNLTDIDKSLSKTFLSELMDNLMMVRTTKFSRNLENELNY